MLKYEKNAECRNFTIEAVSCKAKGRNGKTHYQTIITRNFCFRETKLDIFDKAML